MKRLNISMWILTCISILLCGCWEKWSDAGTSAGWIAGYYSVGDNSDNSNLGTSVTIQADYLLIAFGLNLNNLCAAACSDNNSKYYALCEKYGDIKPGGFVLRRAKSNGTRELYVDKWPAKYAIAEQIDNIEVTADIRWDSEHPEGALLNDIFELGYVTYYPFVQSGWSLDEPGSAIAKPLDELQTGEMKLVDNFHIHTTKLPELESDCYILTLKLYFDTGETSVYKFAMSNEPSYRANSNTCKL